MEIYNPKGATIAISELNFRKHTDIGAAIPVSIHSNNSNIKFTFNYNRETIDIVLSLHYHGYWPKCADG